jgi:hypothetical protein
MAVSAELYMKSYRLFPIITGRANQRIAKTRTHLSHFPGDERPSPSSYESERNSERANLVPFSSATEQRDSLAPVVRWIRAECRSHHAPSRTPGHAQWGMDIDLCQRVRGGNVVATVQFNVSQVLCTLKSTRKRTKYRNPI